MTVERKILIGIAAVIALTMHGPTAYAVTTVAMDKCLASQLKIVGKAAAATTGCRAKAASKGVPVDAACLDKASAKLATALAKVENTRVCLLEGTSATRTTNNTSFGTRIGDTVGGAAGKCDAAKTKLAGKHVAALAICFAKAAGKTGMVDTECVAKALDKLTDGIAKAETKGDCSHLGQTATLVNAAGSFAELETCALQPGAPGCDPCGNGFSDAGEPCDASVGAELWTQCGPDFTCTGCNCACPTTLVFARDAASPDTRLDLGWTGVVHNQPLVGNAEVTMTIANCAGTVRPCGTCEVSGPIVNPEAGAGQLDSRRCSTDTSKPCDSDAVCGAQTCLGGPNDGAPCNDDSACPGGLCPAAGSCVFYLGSTFPLSAGGVTTCSTNHFAGPVAGTLNVESGELATTAMLAMRVHVGAGVVDQPCPRCSDAGSINDGVDGGTCDGGPRVGLACDANGEVPGRPDYGRTSLDCPPSPAGLIATLAIDATNATSPVVKTLTPSSPSCSGAPGSKCLCDTCNNAAAEPCDDHGDCPDPTGPIGPICGGRRCLGGPNTGGACSSNTECPGVTGACLRPGVPTQPAACFDDSTSPGSPYCLDADGDGIGVCDLGPNDPRCTVASGHGQRFCATQDDCGGGAGTCAIAPRSCFLTGGGSFQPAPQLIGTDTLVAVGMEDAPVGDVSHPILGGVFCVAPSGLAAFNVVTGLPGPARSILQGRLVVHP